MVSSRTHRFWSDISRRFGGYFKGRDIQMFLRTWPTVRIRPSEESLQY